MTPGARSSAWRDVPKGILLFFFLFCPGGRPTPVAAQRSLEILQFNATLEVLETGDLRVVEVLQVRFNGSWNGIYRTIPVEYRTPQGFSYRLFLDLQAVTDESGRELKTEVTRERDSRKVKIWVPGAENVTRTISLQYSVPNALRFFEEHDELYWNVTGTEWDVPIQSASALVELPDGVTGLRGTAFTGAFGSSAQDARIQEIEQGFYFETTRGLNFREGLTIVVGWDPGIVARPGALKKGRLFLMANWLLFLPIFSFLIMFQVWRIWGRDPERRTIAPRYEPPEGLSPGEVGTLMDNRPDKRDVTAILVHLAIQRYLRIEEVESEGLLGFFKDTDYRFVQLRDRGDWRGLKRHEQTFLEGIFSGSDFGDSVLLSDLKNEFYRTLTEIRSDLLEGLKDAGFYRHRPDKVLGAFVAVGVISLGLSIPGFLLLADLFMTSPQSAALAGALFALPILGFGIFMPARTVKGTRTLEGILGFQEFLDRVESDRYRRMITSPEMFERFLPYAMALGVEEKWARAFEDIYKEPPDWYVGRHSHAFHTALFVNNLSAMTSQAGTVMASQPRSTGGSGFGGGGGGGGLSGGGFGGGGGGGF
ncbi:MAG: DUF2207 domain-containing protein [Longimicrobiales bacterium]